MYRLGIDIDGVLCNFVQGFVNVAHSLWPDRVPLDYVPETWGFESLHLSDSEIAQVWEIMKNTKNFWTFLPTYSDNAEALRFYLNMRRQEVNIYYITSRVPTKAGDSILIQTQNWLEAWGLLRKNTSVILVGQTSHTEIKAPPKSLIAEALNLDALIDDYLPTVRTLGERGVLLDRPWNRAERSDKIVAVPNLETFLASY